MMYIVTDGDIEYMKTDDYEEAILFEEEEYSNGVEVYIEVIKEDEN